MYGWIRRTRRNLLSFKGLLLAAIGMLLFVPLLISMFISPSMHGRQVNLFRFFGPFALLGFCLLNVVLSSSERALYFSSAEVDFLFAAPFQRRTLLIYRLIFSLGVAFGSAIFMTLVVGRHASSLLSGFVAIFLATELLYLITLVVGLLSSMLAEMVPSRRHTSMVVGTILILISFVTWDRQVIGLSSSQVMKKLVRSPLVYVLTLPFRPFVMAFTSSNLWPDLVMWSAIGLAEVLVLIGVVLMIDVGYHKVAAGASARLLVRLQSSHQDLERSAPEGSRVYLPSFPWWGGVGPNLWRQVVSLTRQPARLLSMALLFLFSMASLYLTLKGNRQTPRGQALSFVGAGMFLNAFLFGPLILGFDFRNDRSHIEELKALPLSPIRIVLGEIATPSLILILSQWMILATTTRLMPSNVARLLATALLIVPLNILFVEIENLFFLWFPTPRTNGIFFDFQTMGRQSLLVIAKLAFVSVITISATVVGALAYFALGGSKIAAFLTAMAVTMIACGAFLPLLATAFVKFDVSRDVPV